MILLIAVVFSLILCFGSIYCIRNCVTYINHRKIIFAICNYQIDCIDNEIPYIVDYDDMESYEKTMCRFWDFGCEHILPKEKFELVKPYLDMENKRE